MKIYYERLIKIHQNDIEKFTAKLASTDEVNKDELRERIMAKQVMISILEKKIALLP